MEGGGPLFNLLGIPLQYQLAISLLIGAVGGTISRLWAAPNIDLKSRKTINEIIGNGLTALIIPFLSAIPVVGESLNLNKIPNVAALVIMFFIASGSGDFLGNMRARITKIITGGGGTDAPPPPPPPPASPPLGGVPGAKP